MGSMPYNVNDKIAKMTISTNETYDSLYERFIDIEKEVEMSLHRVSNTTVVEKFMEILMTLPDVVPRLSAIFAQLKTHIKKQGPNVDFRLTIEEIYDQLVCSGIVPTREIGSSTSSLPSDPQAFAAIVSTDKTKLYPDQDSRQVDKLVPRANRCPVSYLRHDANRCWVRGLKWMPLWLRRSVAKYNALHPNDEPDSTLINAAPPIRQATVKSYNPVTKQAVITFADTDQVVDGINFNEFDNHFTDPEIITSSPPITNPSTTTLNIHTPSPEATTAHLQSSSPPIDPDKIDSLDNNSVDD